MSTDTGRRPIHESMVIFLVLNHYGYVLIGQKMTPKIRFLMTFLGFWTLEPLMTHVPKTLVPHVESCSAAISFRPDLVMLAAVASC